MVKKLKICIIGAESWGSAIATAVGVNAFNSAKFDNRVHLYVYDDLVSENSLSDVINDTHENIKYLPGIHLPENLIAIDDLLVAAKNADILIFSTPKHFVKSYCNILEGHIKSNVISVSLVKGFERISDSEIDLFTNGISNQLGIPCYSFVTANSAMEMAQDKLCEVTIGCDNLEHSQLLREIFQTMNCKVVILPDVEGVELCGALKGIIALGAGFIDGLHLGDNARVAVIHLGLKEIMRFVKSFYPHTKLSTFFESCGVADLVASCYDDNNVAFAKAFVTSGKTIQELESSMTGYKELLGPQIVEQVYNFLSKSNKEDQYPLFTAIHKICQNEQHPESIIDALRNHPDLHYPSIANLLNNELIRTENYPIKSVYEIDDPQYLETQVMDDLSTAEQQQTASFDFQIDDVVFAELPERDTALNVTAEHETDHSTFNLEMQNKDDSMEMMPEYKSGQTIAFNVEDHDFTTPQNKDDFVKIPVTSYSESQNSDDLYDVIAEETQSRTGISEISNPRSLTTTFKDVPAFVESRTRNIVESADSEPPNDPSNNDWMGDDEWRPQDFEFKEIKLPVEEQIDKISDENMQDDWMGDNEWRPQDLSVQRIEYLVDDKISLDKFGLENKVENFGRSPEKESVQILLDFKFGDPDNKILLNKLSSNFVTTNSKNPDPPKVHQEEMAPIKQLGKLENLNDNSKQNKEKFDLVYDPDVDEYAMGPYWNTFAESSVASLSSDSFENTEDSEKKSIKITSSKSENVNPNQPQTPPKQAPYEFDVGDSMEISDTIMELKDKNTHNKNIDQEKIFDMEDSFSTTNQEQQESQYQEPPTMEKNVNNSKSQSNDQAAPSQIQDIEMVDDRLQIENTYNQILEKLAKARSQQGKQMDSFTDFDEIFAELAVATTQIRKKDKKEPGIDMKNIEVSVDYDSLVKALENSALVKDGSRHVAEMTSKDTFEKQGVYHETEMPVSDDFTNRKDLLADQTPMKDDFEKEWRPMDAKMEETQNPKEHKINTEMKQQNKKTMVDASNYTERDANSELKSEQRSEKDFDKNEQLTAWKNLFKEAEREEAKLKSFDDKNQEKSSFEPFKSSDDEEMDKLLSEPFDEEAKRKEADWDWIQLEDQEKSAEIEKPKTPEQNVLLNVPATSQKSADSKSESTPITLNPLKSEVENKKKESESIKLNPLKSEVENKKKESEPIKLNPLKSEVENKKKESESIKLNPLKSEVENKKKESEPIKLNPDKSFELTTHPGIEEDQKSASSEEMTVNVNIAEVEELEVPIEDSVYSFGEESVKPSDSSSSEAFEAFTEHDKSETTKVESEQKPLVNPVVVKPKPRQQEGKEMKEESFYTKRLKYLMDPKNAEAFKQRTLKTRNPFANRKLRELDTTVPEQPTKITRKQALEKRYVMRTPFNPPLNPKVRIPKPPFDGRDHEYHTLACYRLPRPILMKQNNLKRIQSNCTQSEIIGKMPTVHRAKPFFSIMRATKLLCAFQAGMFAAIFSKYSRF